MKKVFIIFCLVSLSMMSMATTYYVSNSGSDTNTGLTGSPWKTLYRVNSTLFKAGDQILFERGSTFYGSITISQSGASGNPIVFGAYGTGSNPVITGFNSVSAWTDLGGNIWESTNIVSTLSTCNVVTFNGVNTAMGRYPDANAANGGFFTIQSSSATSVTNDGLSVTPNYVSRKPNWTGAQVVIRLDNFNLKKVTVTSQSANTLNFDALSAIPQIGNGFFIQNDIRCCNQQNEWYYNPATKKITVASSGKPVNVNVASVDKLITINGSYVTIQNITLTGANLCGIYHATGSAVKNVLITNCTFNCIGLSAIYAGIDYLTVDNNVITESNCNAISTLYSANITIRNNTIQNIGVFAGMRNALSDPLSLTNTAVQINGATNNVIEYNTIKNVGYSAISANGALIKNNFIDTFCNVLDDGGGIYGCHSSVITGNIIVNGIGTPYGISHRFPACGIFLDQSSHDVEISYNTVANCYMYGFFVNSLGHVNSHHNTAYNCSQIQYRSVYWSWPGTAPTTTDQIKNNIFVAKLKESNDMTSNQKCLGFYFVNSAGNSSDNPGVIFASTVLDSNVYARPIGDDKVIFLNVPSWNQCWETLDEWKAYSKKDAHSHKSPQAITSVDDIQIEYNATKNPKTIYFSQPMIDMQGNRNPGVITLQPFTSVVLMKDYSAAEITSFTLPGQIGSSVINTAARTISITMPNGTLLTGLKASFTITPGATAKVLSTTQVSGITLNSFVIPVTYVITAKDGVTTKSWTVKVTVGSSTQGNVTKSAPVVNEAQAPPGDLSPMSTIKEPGIRNYPNPFVDYTTFEFSLNEKADVFLTILDIQGKKIIDVINQNYNPGEYTVIWNGTNQNGQKVSPGIYIYKYRAGNFTCAKKLYLSN